MVKAIKLIFIVQKKRARQGPWMDIIRVIDAIRPR
jgi:hypothetical protein